MNAYTSSDELTLLPANRISYPTPHQLPSPSLLNRITAFFQRQATLNEMASLSDRELRDIGLSRADIDHVFDEGFIARRR